MDTFSNLSPLWPFICILLELLVPNFRVNAALNTGIPITLPDNYIIFPRRPARIEMPTPDFVRILNRRINWSSSGKYYGPEDYLSRNIPIMFQGDEAINMTNGLHRVTSSDYEEDLPPFPDSSYGGDDVEYEDLPDVESTTDSYSRNFSSATGVDTETSTTVSPEEFVTIPPGTTNLPAIANIEPEFPTNAPLEDGKSQTDNTSEAKHEFPTNVTSEDVESQTDNISEAADESSTDYSSEEQEENTNRPLKSESREGKALGQPEIFSLPPTTTISPDNLGSTNVPILAPESSVTSNAVPEPVITSTTAYPPSANPPPLVNFKLNDTSSTVPTTTVASTIWKYTEKTSTTTTTTTTPRPKFGVRPSSFIKPGGIFSGMFKMVRDVSCAIGAAFTRLAASILPKRPTLPRLPVIE